eukprot:TRINITY_DN26541_c0_g1_i1.p1 TRINITY_DN26541_c0_g1~~TRINITY_DN26541_c0_g1_i1.p1  ORF type:complete len:483 (+),score=126.70 TRINITY_DN26541_c0_g1_i1:40-1488(+)
MAAPSVESGWRDLFERLCERFPTLSPDRVAQALRNHNGHAGNAASELRDLTTIKVKPPDPDDAEHVATLLSSPMMFKHACKENFQKFDTNGDGVLDFTEVLALTNELYYSFGLQQPSEACLKAFFQVTDENNDGVLSEREFRRFFEMFLRYAFFDVVKLQQLLERQAATEPKAPELQPASQAPPAASPQAYPSPHGRPAVPQQHAPPQQQPSQPPQEKREQRVKEPKPDKGGNRRGSTYVCVNPDGAPFRRHPEFDEKEEIGPNHVLPQGHGVQVLEHWIRTPYGWLPVWDQNGAPVLEKVSQHRPKAESRTRGESGDAQAAAPAAEPRRRESPPADAGDHGRRSSEAGEARRREEVEAKGRREAEAESRRREREAERRERPAPTEEPEEQRRQRRSSDEERPKAAAAAPVVVDQIPSPQRHRAPEAPAAPAQEADPASVPEELREAVETLSRRFPDAGVARIVQALKTHNGHAGKAAKDLR